MSIAFIRHRPPATRAEMVRSIVWSWFVIGVAISLMAIGFTALLGAVVSALACVALFDTTIDPMLGAYLWQNTLSFIAFGLGIGFAAGFGISTVLVISIARRQSFDQLALVELHLRIRVATEILGGQGMVAFREMLGPIRFGLRWLGTTLAFYVPMRLLIVDPLLDTMPAGDSSGSSIRVVDVITHSYGTLPAYLAALTLLAGLMITLVRTLHSPTASIQEN